MAAGERRKSNFMRIPDNEMGSILREFLAEFFGMFVLMAFGTACSAQKAFSRNENGDALAGHFSWGMSVTIAVYVCGGVSGGHINPAISLAWAVIGRLPWKKVPFYVLAQFIGAFAGAALTYGVYYEAFNNFDGGTRQTSGENKTAQIFSTFPQDYLSVTGGLVDQIVGTAFLAIGVLAITDKRNASVPPSVAPVLVGLLVTIIGTSFNQNCGNAINPARDLAPRLFTAVAGWGFEVFKMKDYYWFWIPIAGPLIGAVLGAALYLLLIEFHWPQEQYDPSTQAQDMTSTPTSDDNKLEDVATDM